MDFEIEGLKIDNCGIFIVKDEFSSNPFIIDMNVIRTCCDTVFKNPEKSLSFSCRSSRSQQAWREAFVVYRDFPGHHYSP